MFSIGPITSLYTQVSGQCCIQHKRWLLLSHILSNSSYKFESVCLIRFQWTTLPVSGTHRGIVKESFVIIDNELDTNVLKHVFYLGLCSTLSFVLIVTFLLSTATLIVFM